MRIISGSAKRHKIEVPKTITRPTTDRTREALFSIINPLVKNANCLDLYAGSGSLGLEALSRGASHCDFIDESREAKQTIQHNLQQLNLKNGQVFQRNVTSFLEKNNNKYDLIFADPPYAKQASDADHATELLNSPHLRQSLNNNAYLIIESLAKQIGQAATGWSIEVQRSYGNCGITIYQPIITN